jgi:hypothetical protein
MTATRAAAIRLYGWLFRLLLVVVPSARELDGVLEMLDGEGDEWIL